MWDHLDHLDQIYNCCILCSICKQKNRVFYVLWYQKKYQAVSENSWSGSIMTKSRFLMTRALVLSVPLYNKSQHRLPFFAEKACLLVIGVIGPNITFLYTTVSIGELSFLPSTPSTILNKQISLDQFQSFVAHAHNATHTHILLFKALGAEHRRQLLV